MAKFNPPDGTVFDWRDSTTTIETQDCETAFLEVSNLSGGDTLVVKASLGATARTLAWVKEDLTTGTTISADGIYQFPAIGILSYTRTGSASNPALNLQLVK